MYLYLFCSKFNGLSIFQGYLDIKSKFGEFYTKQCETPQKYLRCA